MISSRFISYVVSLSVVFFAMTQASKAQSDLIKDIAPDAVAAGTTKYDSPACEKHNERVKKGKKSTGKYAALGDNTVNCRENCMKSSGGSGKYWIGTAPACKGSRKSCTSKNQRYVTWSYCGNGKTCLSGKKVLCNANKKPKKKGGGGGT